MSEQKGRKHLNYLFLNIGSSEQPKWARATKSTDFSITFNPKTESFDFISDEVPTEEVTSYRPSLAQTQHAYIGNQVYDYVISKARNLETGGGATTQAMIVYQELENGKNKADKYNCNLIWNSNDLVAGTVSYTINFNGNPVHGLAEIDGEGNPVFTEK